MQTMPKTRSPLYMKTMLYKLFNYEPLRVLDPNMEKPPSQWFGRQWQA